MTSFLSSSSSSSLLFPLSPITRYENWSYQEQWDQQIQQKYENEANKTSVIFDLHWLDHNSRNNNHNIDDDDDYLFLLGCTSGGEVVCWKTPPPSPKNGDAVADDDAMMMIQASSSSLHYYQKPIWRRRISNGTLYSVQVIHTGSTGKQLLVASGDDGVLIYDWNECLQGEEFTTRRSTSSHDTSKNTEQQLLHQQKSIIQQPLVRFQPYKSPFEQQKGIEINSVAYDAGSQYLFGAAGDAFGCYKWDLQQQVLVATYQSPPGQAGGAGNGQRRGGGGGYLHTLELVPEMAVVVNDDNDVTAASASSSRLLLTGGEDGVLGIWDTKADKLVDRIDMNQAMSKSSSSLSSSSRSQHNQATFYRGRSSAPSTTTGSVVLGDSRWISSCKVVNDTWWTVGGGCCSASSSTNTATTSGGTGGYIATFHAPTRSLVTSVETREVIQQLAVSPTDCTLWSVGNENVACHWGNGSPYTLDNNNSNTHDDLHLQRQRISCTSPSLYAVAITTATTKRPKSTIDRSTCSDCMDVDMNEKKKKTENYNGKMAAGDPCIAVSGVGPTIDLLENGGQPTFRFHL